MKNWFGVARRDSQVKLVRIVVMTSFSDMYRSDV